MTSMGLPFGRARGGAPSRRKGGEGARPYFLAAGLAAAAGAAALAGAAAAGAAGAAGAAAAAGPSSSITVGGTMVTTVRSVLEGTSLQPSGNLSVETCTESAKSRPV